MPRSLALLLRLLLIPSVVWAQEPAAVRAVGARGPLDVVIRDVTVIDVARGVGVPHQSLVVRGTRIAAVGPVGAVRAPAGVQTIDGRGRFLVPGLWDMAAWVLDYRTCNAGTFPLLVAHGVLGVRDLGTKRPLETIRPLRDSIARGLVLGPRLVVSGREIASRDTSWPGQIRTDADVDRAVDSLAAAGADYIKFRQYLSPELLPAVVRAAGRHGLPVTGAVVFGYARAADAGVRGIDHPVDLHRSTSVASAGYAAAYRGGTRGSLEAAFREQFAKLPASARRPGDSAYTTFDQIYAYFGRLRATRDTALYRATLEALARHRTWITTNTSDYGWSLVRFELGDPQRARWRTHGQNVAMYESLGQQRRFWDYDATAAQRQGMLDDLRDLHRAGVPMLAGTQLDCEVANTPGASLHDELQWLTEVGFTPAEALRAATLEPARFLRATDSLGTVARGKVADLVLLDADPLAQVVNTRRIRAVISNGRYFDRAALDSLLAAAERAARTP